MDPVCPSMHIDLLCPVSSCQFCLAQTLYVLATGPLCTENRIRMLSIVSMSLILVMTFQIHFGYVRRITSFDSVSWKTSLAYRS